jgi:hypothetical protein
LTNDFTVENDCNQHDIGHYIKNNFLVNSFNLIIFQTYVAQGQFINKPFQRYQKFLEKANNHSKTQWHIESSIRFNDFINIMSKNSSVHQMINTNYKNNIDANRKKLIPILSSLYFCVT